MEKNGEKMKNKRKKSEKKTTCQQVARKWTHLRLAKRKGCGQRVSVGHFCPILIKFEEISIFNRSLSPAKVDYRL